MFGIDIGMPGFRVDALEHVLLHEGLGFLETNRAFRGAFEKPHITVARDIDQPFDGLPISLIVHQDGRRDLVPIP